MLDTIAYGLIVTLATLFLPIFIFSAAFNIMSGSGKVDVASFVKGASQFISRLIKLVLVLNIYLADAILAVLPKEHLALKTTLKKIVQWCVLLVLTLAALASLYAIGSKAAPHQNPYANPPYQIKNPTL